MKALVGIAASVVAVAVVAFVGSAAGAGEARQAEKGTPPAAAVTIDNFRFAPRTLTVKAGTTVTWTNRDDMPHTVVSTAKAFASEALDTDQTFTHTFAEAGTFDYFCSIHPRMTGRVVVEK